jgi:hypothetical protein
MLICNNSNERKDEEWKLKKTICLANGREMETWKSRKSRMGMGSIKNGRENGKWWFL